MVERNSGVPEEQRIVYRIGIHVGDVVEESDGDLMGDGVNVAARLEGVAKPGGICLSEDAYRQVKSRFDVAIADLGEQKLKNIAEPVRAYSVEVGKASQRTHTKARLPSAQNAAASPRAPTLLVSPLVNATGDAKYDAAARRISDTLIGFLSGSIYWNPVKEADGAGKPTDAAYVLGGNLEAGGPALRISVHLTDAHSGKRLWATTIAPILEDPGAAKAEEEVAGQAATAIRYPIYGAELRRLEQAGNTENGYGCYLQISLIKIADWARLRKCEEAVVAKEPNNAFAWEGLGVVLSDQRLYGWGLAPDEAPAAKRAELAGKVYEVFLRSKELAPDDVEVQGGFAFGNFARCDVDRVRVEVAKTIALNPYSAFSLGWVGRLLAYVGDWDEGVAMTQKAIRLAGPAAFPSWWTPSAMRHFDRGEYQAAYDDFQRAYIESLWTSHLHLAYTLVYVGRIDEAKAQLKTAQAQFPILSVREADGYFKIYCISKPYRDKVVAALRQLGLPE